MTTPASASVINGFSGMSFNGYGSSGTAVTNNVLTLTDNIGDEARSAFTQTAYSISNSAAFTASFVYKAIAPAAPAYAADGFTFCIQNSGPALIGNAGGSLGYYDPGIFPNSAAVQFNIHAMSSTGFGTSGAISDGTNVTTPNVNLVSGDPIRIVLTYNGLANTLTEQLTDQTTRGTATYSYTGVNYQTALGSGTLAYIGFTGATGEGFATQTISNFQFVDGPAGQISLNTNIVATANSTLNMPYPPVTLASLVLSASGNPTLTLAGYNSLTLSGSGGLAVSATGNNGAAAVSGSVPIQIAAGSVNVDAGASLSISVPIQDGTSATAVTKVGGGSLTLAAANTYSGPTTVNGGALAAGALQRPLAIFRCVCGNQWHARHARPHGHGFPANGQVALCRCCRCLEREHRHSSGESQQCDLRPRQHDRHLWSDQRHPAVADDLWRNVLRHVYQRVR